MTPSNEADRLRAVRSYAAVHAEGADGLAAIVRAACAACEAAVGAVTLIDDATQVILSAVGIAIARVPREVSLCAEALQEPHAVFTVEDARMTPRFAHNPLVTHAPHARFHAAAPLVDAGGFAIGTLCVMDTAPHVLTTTERAKLEALALAATGILESCRARFSAETGPAAPSGRALLRQNELHQTAEELTKVGHWHYELATKRLYWSPQLYRIFGKDPDTWTLTPASSLSAYQEDEEGGAVRRLITTAIEKGEPFDCDVRIRRDDGEHRKLHTRGVCEVDRASGETRAVFGVCQDVTERERMREHMVRQERLAAAGMLAAGVGHEINNPLSFVSTNLDFALDELRDLSSDDLALAAPLLEIVTALSEARDGAQRIRKIVRGLQAFAHQDAPSAPIDVSLVLDVATDMVMHEVRHKATLEKSLQDVPLVLADEGGLTHVLVNLILNAAQAFERPDPSQNRIAIATYLTSDEKIVIEVQDNGPGIEPDVLPRIFDPYFTTKDVGHGRGLGLSLCHGIVAALGGEIRCDTQVARGTTFRVLLPRAVAATRVSEVPRSGTSPTLRGRVLLVDDEPDLLRAIARVLRPDHDVVAFSDPREARRVLASDGDRFDVVLCDLMMPHMSGIQLFHEVRRSDPAMAEKFVFMTAGAISEEARAFLARAENPRVDKPFGNQVLRALVHTLVQKFARAAKSEGESAVSSRPR